MYGWQRPLAMELEVGDNGTAGPSRLGYYKHQTASPLFSYSKHNTCCTRIWCTCVHSLCISTSARQRCACVFLVCMYLSLVQTFFTFLRVLWPCHCERCCECRCALTVTLAVEVVSKVIILCLQVPLAFHCCLL